MINEVMIIQGRNVGMERTEWTRIHLQSDMEDKGKFLGWITWWMVSPSLMRFETQKVKGQVLLV